MILFDSRLNFILHFGKKIRKTKAYGLCPDFVKNIQIVPLQSVALYLAELLWKNQKTIKRNHRIQLTDSSVLLQKCIKVRLLLS